MIAEYLKYGGTIGICSPSHIADREKYAVLIAGLKSLGFKVKEAENLYKTTRGYLASAEERGADFNSLIADDEVQLILFGGGEGSNELLPFIDFENIKKHPKRICTYSDGTTILNAVWANTGLEVYYGQSPNFFGDVTEYDKRNFLSFLVTGEDSRHISAKPWRCIAVGQARGTLIGGYSRNMNMLIGTKYYPIDPDRNYILFIEDHEKFGKMDYISAMLSHMEMSPLMPSVKGFLFGCYSDTEHPELYDRIRRLADRWHIPAAYTDDFGHGQYHAVLRIGHEAAIDTEKGTLLYY